MQADRLRPLADGIAGHGAGVGQRLPATYVNFYFVNGALVLVAYALAPALGHAAVLLAGHGVDLEWLHASAFHALVLAAVVLVLAEVMRIGRAVEQDRDGFV